MICWKVVFLASYEGIMAKIKFKLKVDYFYQLSKKGSHLSEVKNKIRLSTWGRTKFNSGKNNSGKNLILRWRIWFWKFFFERKKIKIENFFFFFFHFSKNKKRIPNFLFLNLERLGKKLDPKRLFATKKSLKSHY